MESYRRVSETGLYDQQRSYYDERGVDAWRLGEVPYGVTNSPNLAKTYVDLIEAYLRDLLLQGELADGRPLHVVEMGAGLGRLGFYILRELEKRVLPARVTYVLTDFSDSNLEFWRTQAGLQPFFETGALDLGIYDAEGGGELLLERAGAALDLSNPVVFLANYLFDTLRQDAFRINCGELYDCLTQARVEEGMLKLDYQYVPVEGKAYDDPVYHGILEEYCRVLGDTHVLIPIGAFRCLENLIEMTEGRMLLLAGDKGSSTLSEWSRLGPHQPVMHGAGFSFHTNFHALGLLTESRGGAALHSEVRDTLLCISAFYFGSAERPHLSHAFEELVEGFAPIDFIQLKSSLAQELEHQSLRLCLDQLRLSRWDPDLLYELREHLNRGVGHASQLQKREVHRALSRVWARNYLVTGGRDMAFEIGRILAHMELYDQAIEFYHESLATFGPAPASYCNLGVCHHSLRDLRASLAAFEKALELDPANDAARDWRVTVRTEMENSGSFCPVQSASPR